MQDYSGSTAGCEYYHDMCGALFEDFKVDANKSGSIIRLGLWDDRCQETTEKELWNIWENREGRRSTCPQQIPLWIKDNLPQGSVIHLWLITDGQIGRRDIEEARSANQGIKYAEVKFFIYNRDIDDISVGLGFVQEKITVFLNEEDAVVASLSFDYDAVNKDNFEKKQPELYAHVGLMAMTKPAQAVAELEQIKKLRDRILRDVLPSKGANEVPTSFSTRKEDIIEVVKKMPFFRALEEKAGESIDGFFSTLINRIHVGQKGSYSFSTINYKSKMDKMINQPLANEPIEEEVESDYEYLEPITLETEGNTAMLLLRVTNLIEKVWKNGSSSKFHSLISCPLFAKSFVDDSVDHVVSVESFNSLPTIGEVKKSPYTRADVFGGIVIPMDGEDRLDVWNDYVIAKTFFDGKKVETMSLWYYVLLASAREKEWVPKQFIARLEEYAYRRMGKSRVPLALSTLPLDPKERVPVDFCLRYCTDISACLFAEDPVLFKMERLRQFAGVASMMLEILQHYRHVIDVDFVRRRSFVLLLSNALKRLPRWKDKALHVLSMLFEEESLGKIKFLTTQVKDMSKAKYLHMIGEEFHLKPIPLDYDGKEGCPVKGFVHATCEWEDGSARLPSLCNKTWRPPFVLTAPNNEAEPYYTRLKGMKEVTFSTDNTIVFTEPRGIDFSKLISCFQQYIDYVRSENKHPTLEEYASFVHKKKRFVTVNKVTKVRLFPRGIVKVVQEVYSMYKDARENDTVEAFLKKVTRSVTIEDRIQMEGAHIADVKAFVEDAKRQIK